MEIRGSGRDGAPQLPAIAGGILTEHDPEIVTVESRVFYSGLLQPHFQRREVSFDFDRHVCPCCRAMVGILAQVDLLAIPALEPPSLARELLGCDDAAIAEDPEEESLFGLRSSNGHSEVHVMKPQHD